MQHDPIGWSTTAAVKRLNVRILAILSDNWRHNNSPIAARNPPDLQLRFHRLTALTELATLSAPENRHTHCQPSASDSCSAATIPGLRCAQNRKDFVLGTLDRPSPALDAFCAPHPATQRSGSCRIPQRSRCARAKRPATAACCAQRSPTRFQAERDNNRRSEWRARSSRPAPTAGLSSEANAARRRSGTGSLAIEIAISSIFTGGKKPLLNQNR